MVWGKARLEVGMVKSLKDVNSVLTTLPVDDIKRTLLQQMAPIFF